MKKITTIPPEAQAKFPAIVQEYIKIGLCTDPADRPTAEKAMRDLYKLLGKRTDMPIVWVPSPLVGAFAAPIAAALLSKKTATSEVSVYKTIEKSVGPVVSAAVKVAVEAAVGYKTKSTTTKGGEGVDAATIRSTIKSLWHYYRGGQFWVSWKGYIAALRLIGFEHESLRALEIEEKIARSAGWYWPFEDFVMISERPNCINRDALGRLHSLDGPSISWGETFSLHSWKGITVPAALIDNRRTVTAAEVLAIENAEHRRCAIEIYALTHGPDRFVKDLGAKKLKGDKSHGKGRTVYAVGDARYIHVTNGSREPDGTFREFILGADPRATTPNEVVASSYGRPAPKYKEAVRT
jgi:hypothetical protein